MNDPNCGYSRTYRLDGQLPWASVSDETAARTARSVNGATIVRGGQSDVVSFGCMCLTRCFEKRDLRDRGPVVVDFLQVVACHKCYAVWPTRTSSCLLVLVDLYAVEYMQQCSLACVADFWCVDSGVTIHSG